LFSRNTIADNAYLHEGLGVPSIPFGHIYYPNAGLVEEQKINKHVFANFEKTLEQYLQGYCHVPEQENEGLDNTNKTPSDPSSM